MKKILIVYTVVLLYVVVMKGNITIDSFKDMVAEFRGNNYDRVNLNIFSTIKMQLRILNKNSVINLLVNTIPFIIYGVIFKLAFIEKKNKILCFSAFTLVLLIEIFQYIFFIGAFDIDDILLNYISIIIGFLIIICTRKIIIKKGYIKKF